MSVEFAKPTIGDHFVRTIQEDSTFNIRNTGAALNTSSYTISAINGNGLVMSSPNKTIFSESKVLAFLDDNGLVVPRQTIDFLGNDDATVGGIVSLVNSEGFGVQLVNVVNNKILPVSFVGDAVRRGNFIAGLDTGVVQYLSTTPGFVGLESGLRQVVYKDNFLKFNEGGGETITDNRGNSVTFSSTKVDPRLVNIENAGPDLQSVNVSDEIFVSGAGGKLLKDFDYKTRLDEIFNRIGQDVTVTVDTSRLAQIELTIADSIRNLTIFDNDGDTTHTLDSSGRVSSTTTTTEGVTDADDIAVTVTGGKTEIRIGGVGLGINFSEIGGELGARLGARLAAKSGVVGRTVSSTFFDTLGTSLGRAVDGVVIGDLSVGKAVSNGFKSFPSDFLSNLKTAGIGAVSSYLTAELVSGLGVDGFAGELLNSVGSAAIATIIGNISNLGKLAADGTKITVFKNVDGMLASAAGAALGAKLANSIVRFKSVGGQLGASIGASIGNIVAGKIIGNAIAGPLGEFIGSAVGTFIGTIVGGVIGSIFGGTPRSGADVEFDAASGRFTVDNVYSRKGGSKDAARSVAGAVAETFNTVLEATGRKAAESRCRSNRQLRTACFNLRLSPDLYTQQGRNHGAF